MIAGIWPRYFRGEDWNLNGRLDPNENDSGRSFPPDESDNIMRAGWSEHLTVYSVDGGATDSGLPRIHLKEAEDDELIERLGIAARLKKRVVVEGHTDSQGQDDANQRLSQSRAQAVVTFLSSQGVASGRLSAVGRGESEPVASNANAEGRANNRRVELVIQNTAARPVASR